MNFSVNPKCKRFLSAALVLMMVTTLFAGCKKDIPAPETEPNLNLNISDPTTSSEADPTTQATEAPVINENTGTVTSVLNIRSSPSTEATVIGTLYAGDKVEVSRREVVTGIDWAYIIAPESGWIVMEFVEMDIPSQQPLQPDTSTPAGSNPPADSDTTNTNTTNIKAVVNANGLNIRSEASKNGKVQGAYNKGDVITILETKDGWGRTNKGWVKLEYVNTNSTTVGGSSTTDKTDNKDLPEIYEILQAPQVKKVVLIGESGHELASRYQDNRFILANSLDQAVEIAKNTAEQLENAIVVMSPAAASFDMFENVYDRGARYQNLIKNLEV